MSSSLPLTGIRVLDLSRVLAGPYCTMMLGDLGAEVIKVEQPGVGDETRRWGPPFAGTDTERESAYFLSVNRNKRGIAVDFQTTAGQEIIRALALVSDIVVENLRPATLARLGLDYHALSQYKTDLIWCTISGYGPVGPRQGDAGYDFIAQAETGIMAITGPVDGEPTKVGVAIVDITTGMYAATGILAALHRRQQTGKGEHIEVSLFGSGLAWLANIGQNYLSAGEDSIRQGNAHRSIVPYETFQAADRTFALGVGTDRQYRLLCQILTRPELADDPRFATNSARVANRAELIALLNAAFRERPAETWLQLLRAAAIPCGPINTVGEAVRSPQAEALGTITRIPHPTVGEVPLVGLPYHVSGFSEIRRPPPRLGEHTDLILQEILQYNTQRIATLREQGVIG